MNENEISRIVVNTSIQIHRDLGPGLLESVYEKVLQKSLQDEGLLVVSQAPIRLRYRGMLFEEAFRADLIVNNLVILELKSLETLNKAHYKQLITYLKLTDLRLGLLLNFGAPLMKDGIVRFVNKLPE
jgi:GxxExxY protein